jgi:hypothetical protein
MTHHLITKVIIGVEENHIDVLPCPDGDVGRLIRYNSSAHTVVSNWREDKVRTGI